MKKQIGFIIVLCMHCIGCLSTDFQFELSENDSHILSSSSGALIMKLHKATLKEDTALCTEGSLTIASTTEATTPFPFVKKTTFSDCIVNVEIMKAEKIYLITPKVKGTLSISFQEDPKNVENPEELIGILTINLTDVRFVYRLEEESSLMTTQNLTGMLVLNPSSSTSLIEGSIGASLQLTKENIFNSKLNVGLYSSYIVQTTKFGISTTSNDSSIESEKLLEGTMSITYSDTSRKRESTELKFSVSELFSKEDYQFIIE